MSAWNTTTFSGAITASKPWFIEFGEDYLGPSLAQFGRLSMYLMLHNCVIEVLRRRGA
jgi:hypothetical protein